MMYVLNISSLFNSFSTLNYYNNAVSESFDYKKKKKKNKIVHWNSILRKIQKTQ